MTINKETTFAITITCTGNEAEIICEALHDGYRQNRINLGYSNEKVSVIREARNAFANAIGRMYMGEDR